MKKIFCELCEGTEFTKDNGMFVCNGCGTKYTAEEARSLMREVEGDVPVSTGAPVVGAPMGNPNQAQIDNLLLLATNAYDASNLSEAENYCNRAIELDSTCYKAWFLKARAMGWASSIANDRTKESAHSFCKAIDFAPEEEKEDIQRQAIEELKTLGLAGISQRKKLFAESPTKKNLDGFTTERTILLESLLTLLKHGYKVEEPKDYYAQIAKMMNEAAVAAFNMARAAWGELQYPNKESWDTYIGWLSNIEELLQIAIDASEDDDEEDITRYKNMIIVLEEPYDAWSYKRVWNSYSGSYQYVKEYHLADSAINSRKAQVAKIKKTIAALEMKIAAEKMQKEMEAKAAKAERIKAYWEAHAEEKAALDAEMSSLKEKVRNIDIEMKGLEAEIKAATPSGPVPAEDETAKLNLQIKELESRRAKLGMFAGKEKKQIGEEIAALYGRIDSLKAKIEEEKKARKKEADKEIAPLKSKYDELRVEHDKATKRISAIKAELTKDPEE